MIPIQSTQFPSLKFNVKTNQLSQKAMASSNKIGWIHTVSNKPGAVFDLTIKDALGRVKMQKIGCKTQTDKYGELINLPTMLGEELTVELNNVKNVDTVDLFLN